MTAATDYLASLHRINADPAVIDAATDVHPWPRFHLFNPSRRTLTAAALTLFPLLALVTCSHPAG